MKPLEKSTKIKLTIAVVCLLVFGIIGFKYFGTKNNAENKKARLPQEIDVVVLQPQEVTISSSYIGRVEAINDVKLTSYINGYVAEILVQGGQEVTQGRRLVVLRQEEYTAALMAAESELFVAKAEFLNAKVKYKRMQKAGDKAVSRQDIDDARAAYLSAQGKLEKAKADKLSAQTNFDYTILSAPFTGTVGNVALSVGDFVSPQGEALMQIIQYNPIRVVFSLSDKEYLRLSESLFDTDRVKISLQLADGYTFPEAGNIKYTANEINNKTNSIAVYAEFSNSSRLLIPNAYVKVLLEHQYKNVVLIEKNIVDLKPDGDYIYMVHNNIVELRRISILDEQDGVYVVKNDFPPDVFLPTDKITSDMVGQKVEIHLVRKDE